MTMPPLATEVTLASLTTLQVGGPAEYLARVTSEAELQTVCRWARSKQLPVRVLGGGSNVLVSATGVRGVVVLLEMRGQSYEEQGEQVFVTAAAGEELDALVADTVARGYWGLENLSYIPGTVGATPVQNVGAYGVETSDVLVSLRAYDRTADSFIDIDAADCAFGYRDSRFKRADNALIITAVTYRLSSTPQPRVEYQGLQVAGLDSTSSLAEIRATVGQVRAGKFPDWRQVGTAGSFFKNPIVPDAVAAPLIQNYPELPTYQAEPGYTKVSLGYVLDKVCGLRGYRVGAVELSPKQALVLVAYEGATAAAVDAFAIEVAAIVREKTGLVIEREVTGWGL